MPFHCAHATHRRASQRRLEILSLARNNISRIEGLEPVADTLQQLWLSYNQILTIGGVASLPQLKVLYLANNAIRDLKELDNLPPCLEARDDDVA